MLGNILSYSLPVAPGQAVRYLYDTVNFTNTQFNCLDPCLGLSRS